MKHSHTPLEAINAKCKILNKLMKELRKHLSQYDDAKFAQFATNTRNYDSLNRIRKTLLELEGTFDQRPSLMSELKRITFILSAEMDSRDIGPDFGKARGRL